MNESLRAIAAKASSIHERLTAPDLIPIVDAAHDEIVEARMRAWLAAAAPMSSHRRQSCGFSSIARSINRVRLRAISCI
jgi:hypothetical protein